MKRITLLATLIFAVFALNAQVEAVEDFIKANPDLDDFYIYQSTLRMLNQDGNEDFNNLIKDVRKINAYVADGNSEVTKESYDTMIDRLDSDGFELYVKAKYEGAHINLMGIDKGKNSYYVLAVRDTDSFALLEMDGQLDLSYLTALNRVDFGKLQEILLEDN